MKMNITVKVSLKHDPSCSREFSGHCAEDEKRELYEQLRMERDLFWMKQKIKVLLPRHMGVEEHSYAHGTSIKEQSPLQESSLDVNI